MPQNLSNNIKLGVLFALATALLGASASAAGKVLAASLAPEVIIMVQSAICLAIISPKILWQLHHTGWQVPEFPFKLHLIRGFGGLASFYLFYIALQQIPLVNGQLLRNTAPLFVPLVVFLWLRIRVPASRWPPLLIGFVGISLVLKPLTGGDGFNMAALAGLGSGAALAVSMVGTRLLSANQSSGYILFCYFAISFVLSLPLGLLRWQAIPTSAWPYILFIGLSIFAAMWTYTKAYSYAKPSIVSPISYFAVVFSGLLGWLLWSHVPDLLSIIGIGLVVLAGISTVFLNGDG